MSEYGAPPPPPNEPPNQPPPYQPPAPPPQYGQPADPQYGQPAPPQYGQPGQPPQYGQPGQPQYGQPQHPQQQYPQQQYGQPQYPPAGPGGYAAGFGAPVPGLAPADMGKRLLARIIDGVLVGIVYSILFSIFFAGAATRVTVDAEGNITSGGRGFFATLIIAFVLIAVITVAYEVVLIALRGATLGKQLMGIKVVLERGGGLPGWGPSALRWVVPQAAGWVTCGIGQLVTYLSPYFDSTKRNQGWHDKVAGTLVVNAR